MILAHDVTGGGEPVLLLHSTVCDRRMWDPQVPTLVEAGFQVVRCDLPGFGQTPVRTQPYDTAQEVVDLVDGLDIERVAIIGASGGGAVGIEVATRWPQRVTSMALLATATEDFEPSPQLEALWEQEEALLDAGELAAATDLNVERWLGPDADDATRDKVRQMQRHAFEVQLAADEADPIEVDHDIAAITCPVLLVTGAHDFTDFAEIAAGIADTVTDAREVHLDWAGHLPSLERPHALDPLLIDFLRGGAGVG